MAPVQGMYRYRAKIWDSYAEAYLSDFPPNFNIIEIRPSFVDLHLLQSGPNAAGGNGVILLSLLLQEVPSDPTSIPM